MSINRIGSAALLNDTLSQVVGTQSKLGTLQVAISSGIKSNQFAGLSGQVEQYTQFNAQTRRADKFKEENTVTISKMQTAAVAITNLTQLADNMMKLIVNARNGSTGTSLGLDFQMKNYLNSLGDALNTSFAGNYIFGGTNSAIPPVPNTSSPPVAQGIADDSYYVGSKNDVELRSDELTSYKFPVRADDAAFQKIYAAAHQAIYAYASKSDDEMKKAQVLLQDGQKDLISAAARVSNTIINTQATNNQLTALSAYWKGLANDVSQTDLVAASTKVSSYEAILQATFQVYARLSQLRLSDYLK
jgi:flagellar hook-associated protein 3 FlgL